MMGRYHLSDDAHPEGLMKPVTFLLTAAVVLAACDTATAPRSMQSSVDDSRVPAALRARDTVVDVFGIHARGRSTRSLLLQLLGNETWVERLARREIPTGEPTVDTLLARYSLSVGTVYTLHDGDVLITLGPPEPLNITALAGLFRGISGVRFAQPNNLIGDGNDIGGLIDGSRVLLDYSVGYGDCPSGCIARRFYHFAVRDDGTVEYLGASGSPPPHPGSP